MKWLLALLPLVAAAPTPDTPTSGTVPAPGQVQEQVDALETLDTNHWKRFKSGVSLMEEPAALRALLDLQSRMTGVL